MIPTQRKETMQKTKSEKMKHQSFVLPEVEREAFHYLCFRMKLTPSEALRRMVRTFLYGQSTGKGVHK